MTRILLAVLLAALCPLYVQAAEPDDSRSAAQENALMRRDRVGLSPSSIRDTFEGVDLGREWQGLKDFGSGLMSMDLSAYVLFGFFGLALIGIAVFGFRRLRAWGRQDA